MKRMIVGVAATLCAGLALAGCSMTPKVQKSEVEKQVSTQLEQQVGTKPEKIECPGDLEGKVGAKMTCKLTHGGSSLDVFVTVTSVENNNVKFDIKVAES